MPLGLIFLRKFISFPLHRFDMQNFWTGDIAQVSQRIHQLGDVMSIDRTEITKLQCFKQVAAAAHESFQTGFQFAGHFTRKILSYWELSQCLPHVIAKIIVGMGGCNISQVFFECAHIRVDAHAIVIQDNQHIAVGGAGMIHGFESKASG